jgi:hypothetical protein
LSFSRICQDRRGDLSEMKGLLSADLSLGAAKEWIVQVVSGVSV